MGVLDLYCPLNTPLPIHHRCHTCSRQFDRIVVGPPRGHTGPVWQATSEGCSLSNKEDRTSVWPIHFQTTDLPPLLPFGGSWLVISASAAPL
jgi:hypothetical protein